MVEERNDASIAEVAFGFDIFNNICQLSIVMLLYHHCSSLDNVIYGEVRANPEHSDPDFKDAYSWLEKEVDFYPLFLSVGTTDEDIRMTGYQNQWRRIVSEGKNGTGYGGRGEFPNDVLFSFESVGGVFMDYDYWHRVLGAGYKEYHMTEYEKRLIFKPSWSPSQWLRKAKKDSHSVQLVTPGLYLPDAKRIFVRNQQTQELLTSMGFENIEVRRLVLEEPERN